MRPLKIILAVVVALVLGGGVLITKTYWWNSWQTDSFQSQFDEFYAVPDPIVGEVGDILRQERAPDYDVKDGEATRILFVSETEAGEKRVSGGTVWTPTKASASAQDRRVVAWAHPTLGLGVSCSPSRQSELNLDPAGIVPGMMAKNWVVTAADYVGLGTPPQEQTYLIGQQEARDVINSVRAARNLSDGAAGKQWAVYGHSQGGHASLWAANTAKDYAPELELVGAAAAAPAADLNATIEQQWNTIVSWVIGPDVVVSWRNVYRNLDMSIVSVSESTTSAQSTDCNQTAGIFGLLRTELLGQNYFNSNPLESPSWAKAMGEQTPKPPAANIPIFISEGTADEVVLANSTAALQVQWCKAGVDLTMQWLGELKHEQVGVASAPAVTNWIHDRFEGESTTPNCSIAPPVEPYEPSVAVPPIPSS